MGRLSKKPIKLLAGVTFRQAGKELIFEGSKGKLGLNIIPFVTVALEGDSLIVRSEVDNKQAMMNEGTMWSLVKNAVQGVAEGFTKNLEINGIGYKVNLEGHTLILHLGFTQPIRFDLPVGVTITVEKNLIKISSTDKQLVGQAAAEIRAFKKPEPYKGKGIRYQGEVVRRKAGKKAITGSVTG